MILKTYANKLPTHSNSKSPFFKATVYTQVWIKAKTLEISLKRGNLTGS
jgi:hypothetical protein